MQFSEKKALIILGLALGLFFSHARARDNSPQEHKNRKLLIIAIDGMDSRWVNQEVTPFIYSLQQGGSSTLSMRNVTPTITAPNFTSILTGTLPSVHQIFDNEWSPESGITPPKSVFDLFEREPEKVLIISDDWDFYQNAFARAPRPEYPSVVVKRVRHDNPGYLKTAKKTVDIATEKIASHKPNLAFLYLQHVDHIGHTSFWGSGDYIDALSQTDQWLQELIQKIDTDGSYHIMVITDHGGAGNHHANGDLNENVRNIPFVAYGPTFHKDHLISPSRTTQIAPTVAHLFGQPPLEGWPDHGMTDIFKPVR